MISERVYIDTIKDFLKGSIKTEIFSNIIKSNNNLDLAILITNHEFINNISIDLLNNIYKFNIKNNIIFNKDIDKVSELVKSSIIKNIKKNKFNLKYIIEYDKENNLKKNKERMYKDIINIMKIKKSITNIIFELENILVIDLYQSRKLLINTILIIILVCIFLISIFFYLSFVHKL